MPIELHAYDTPNGRKISVALEEMALPYTVKIVDLEYAQRSAGSKKSGVFPSNSARQIARSSTV